MSQGIGRPEEERDGGWQFGGAVRTHTTFMKFASMVLQNNYHSNQRLLITNHHKNIIIKKKFELLRELLKCDTETGCWENGANRLALRKVVTKLQFIKNSASAKCNRMMYSCIILSSCFHQI